MTTSKRIERIGFSFLAANARRAAFIPWLLLAGCAAQTSVEMSGPGARERWCAPDLSAEAVWEAPAAREAIAERGIRRFFAESGCFESTLVSRAGAPAASVDRTIVITVRELGPDVALDIAAVDNGAERARFRVRWKGAGRLEEDLIAALRAALMGP